MKLGFTIGLLLSTCCLNFAQEAPVQIHRMNLGENINSPSLEMSPKLSADGRVMYFVREGHPGNKNQQDIWYSVKDDKGHWSEAKIADPTLNRLEANSVWAVNADGNLVVIRGAFKEGAFIGRGFSVTSQTESGWTDPVTIVIDDIENLDHGDNDGISLSLNTRVMFITMCEKTNCNNYDLYVSIKKDENSYSRPIKLNAKINSEFNEFAPYIAPDNKTLYFSSDRPGGLGLTDIYKVERLDTSWTNWSEPVNLGALINTPEKDGYYVTDAKGEFAYLVSEQNSFGKADIERIKVSKLQMPQPVVLVDGRIFNAKTKKQIAATVEYFIYPDDEDEGIVHTDHVSGTYKMVLPFGDNYAINIRAKGYIPYYDTISLPGNQEYREIKRDYYLTPMEVGQSIVLKHVFFESGKIDLLPESNYELNRVVKLMKSDPKMVVEIAGHTDDVGEEEDNRKLSQERATSIKTFMVTNGIETKRIKARGYGETKPLVVNSNEKNRQINRRVEFKILKK